MNEKLANPTPLGLLGFGMTTVLLNLHNAFPHIFPMDSMILAMGLFYGGLAQVIAGIMEYRNGNTFGTTAFCSYGLFWWSLVALIIMPTVAFFDVAKPLGAATAAYFLMWGLFTFIMFFGTFKTNRVLQFVFLSLAILFFLLTARDITGNTTIATITGFEGIICGLSAFYLALAEVVNEVHEKTILPTWPINK